MKKLNQVWSFLNGKKMALGIFLGVIYYGAVSMNLTAPNQTVENLIIALVGVGAAHKVIKS